MQDHQVEQWRSLHFFTSAQVLRGHLYCPKEMRLLDVLNGRHALGAVREQVFLEFSTRPQNSPEPTQQSPKAYVRKTSLQLVAVDDPNLARGVGGRSGAKPYPYTNKSPVRVRVQLQDYSVAGNLYLAVGQSIASVLNDEVQFLPLTDTTVGRDHGQGQGLFTSRPLVLVNKGQIVSVREDMPAVEAPTVLP